MSVLVSRSAPDFTAAAVLGSGEIVDSFTLSEAIKGKKAVLFFYPLDFTFVCPSELIAFNKRYEEFVKRGVEVIAVSIDSQFTHNAWRNTPINEGGIGPVKFAMIADVKHDICQALEHRCGRSWHSVTSRSAGRQGGGGGGGGRGARTAYEDAWVCV